MASQKRQSEWVRPAERTGTTGEEANDVRLEIYSRQSAHHVPGSAMVTQL